MYVCACVCIYIYIYIYIYIFFFGTWGIWDLSPVTRDQTCTSCIGRQSLNHWTTREVPRMWLCCQLVEGWEQTRVRNVWENSVPGMKLFFREVILCFDRNFSFGKVSPLSNYLQQCSILGANLVQFQGKLKTGKRQNSYEVQRRQWHPTPVLLLGKAHGRRSLVGCSPWGC